MNYYVSVRITISPPVDSIWARMTVWWLREKIPELLRAVLSTSCAQSNACM